MVCTATCAYASDIDRDSRVCMARECTQAYTQAYTETDRDAARQRLYAARPTFLYNAAKRRTYTVQLVRYAEA